MKVVFEGSALRWMGSAAIVAALASACGGSGGDGDGAGATAGDDSQNEAGESSGGAPRGGSGGASSGGMNETSAGAGGASAGASASNGGTTGAAGAGGKSPASGGTGGTDVSAPLDDSGKASLQGKDGITGVASGTLFARTMNIETRVLTPEYMLLEADDGARGNWTLHIPTKVGVYGCDTQGDDETASVSLNDGGTHAIRGTATERLGGGCTLEVTSITGPIEGRFVGQLAGVLGALHPVTSGYFHFTESPIGDCSEAMDPGVSSDELAATMSVTRIDAQGKVPWKCGANGTLAAGYSTAGNDPEFSFRGEVGGREWTLRIDGIRGTGTYTCGMDGVALMVDLTWGGENGGTCTVDVTEYGPDGVVGTYEASLWNGIVAGHATVDIEGSFRTKPTYP